MTTQITPDLVRAALLYIPPALPRDEWARVAMAIKSEFPDDTGRDLFTDWSATAEDFDSKATAGTWRSVKAGGGVRINTLLFLAKSHGFEIPKAHQAATPPSAEAVALHKLHQAERLQAEQAATDTAHAAAATEAAARWAQASDTGHSAYLDRKGVLPHGVRFDAAGGLLVPVRDAAGQLWNIQGIAPAKPADGGSDKLFIKGGRKSGLWHMLGAIGEAPSGPLGDVAGDVAPGVQPVPQIGTSRLPAVLLVAEGYATAASLFEATGYPCAVAFDAGNLAAVSKALRQHYPAALLVLCGDDDLQTYAEKGINPGRDKATAAAKAVQGVAVFPALLPEGGTDFNDLHAARGLDTVRRLVQAAIDQYQPAAMPPTKSPKKAAPRLIHSADTSPTVEGKDIEGVRTTLDRFHSDDSGLWFTAPSDDGNASPKRVCGPLRVLAMARNVKDNAAALLLEFDTDYRKGRRWMMPLSMLAGDGAAYRAVLFDMGFIAPTGMNQRRWLTDYLQSRKNLPLARHVSRIGWHGRCYVLPEETLGDDAEEPTIFHSENGTEANFSRRGTLNSWRDNLGKYCVGNSRLAFAVSCAFAGPLLAWSPGTTGGGFHYVGLTSVGKTTGLLLAASVWGRGAEKDPDSFLQKWRATSNGLEVLGEQHNDCTLVLDELAQMDANQAGEAAYCLADGQGKIRAKSGGGNRPKHSWRLLYLSSGEVTLAQHIESVGKKMRGGQEVRLIPIPAEVSPGTTLEHLHDIASGHAFSGWVHRYAAKHYGTAGRAWLEWLVAQVDRLDERVQAMQARIERELVPAGATGQVQRAGKRFALVAVGGEFATLAGITGWPEGEATRAAKTCFNAWVESRGGVGSSDESKMLRQVKSFFQKHGEGRFTHWGKAAKDDYSHGSKTLNAVGFRRRAKTADPLDDTAPMDFYVFSEPFRDEICADYNSKDVCRLLVQLGCMETEEGGRCDMKTRLPNMGFSRCYRINAKIFEVDV